jgi:hypothetical protein
MMIVLAMLHMLFALGMLLQKSWAWWLDLSPSVISILLVLNIVVLGEPASRAAFWMIVPIIIAMYLYRGQDTRRACNPPVRWAA